MRSILSLDLHVGDLRQFRDVHQEHHVCRVCRACHVCHVRPARPVVRSEARSARRAHEGSGSGQPGASRLFSRPRFLDLLSLGTLLALLFLPSPAPAAVRPFVFAGGQGTKTEKEDVDAFLNDITIRDQTSSWEAGAGLRFFPRALTEGTGSGSGRDPGWEVRVRLGLGGGDLPGTTIHVQRPPPREYEFTSREKFEYTGWTFGVAFLTRVLPWLGAYAGPALQSVHFKGERNWEGPIPEFCDRCGDGKDKATIRYGLLELGARLHPLPQPLSLEAYWIPKRFELSTDHQVQSDTYISNFGSLDGSFGARLTFDF